MSVRLNRAEFWLLTSLVPHALPLAIFGLPEGPPWDRNTIQQVLNHEGHGLDVPAFARVLARLLARGWLALEAPPGGHPAPLMQPTRVALERALDRSGPLIESHRVALTPAGGAAWEAFARPDWRRVVDDSSALGDGLEEHWWQREIIAADQDFLASYMHAVRQEEDIWPGSETVDSIADWEISYWKPHATGYRWTFVGRERARPDHYGTPRSMRLREHWCQWR